MSEFQILPPQPHSFSLSLSRHSGIVSPVVTTPDTHIMLNVRSKTIQMILRTPEGTDLAIGNCCPAQARYLLEKQLACWDGSAEEAILLAPNQIVSSNKTYKAKTYEEKLRWEPKKVYPIAGIDYSVHPSQSLQEIHDANFGGFHLNSCAERLRQEMAEGPQYTYEGMTEEEVASYFSEANSGVEPFDFTDCDPYSGALLVPDVFAEDIPEVAAVVALNTPTRKYAGWGPNGTKQFLENEYWTEDYQHVMPLKFGIPASKDHVGGKSLPEPILTSTKLVDVLPVLEDLKLYDETPTGITGHIGSETVPFDITKEKSWDLFSLPAKLEPVISDTWPMPESCWADAFSVLEGLADATVKLWFMNPVDFIRTSPDTYDETRDPNIFIMWGARVYVTDQVPAGTGYLIGEAMQEDSESGLSKSVGQILLPVIRNRF